RDGGSVLDRARRRRARGLVDQPHLAEVPARLELRDLEPALEHVDLAAEEDVDLVALFALLDDVLPLLELPPAGDAEDGEQLLVGHVLEERDAAEDLGLALDVAGLLVLVGFDGEADRSDVVLEIGRASCREWV